MVAGMARYLGLPEGKTDFFDAGLIHHDEKGTGNINDPRHRELYEELIGIAEEEKRKVEKRKVGRWEGRKVGKRIKGKKGDRQYFYRIFGLTIESSIEIPGLTQATSGSKTKERTDVRIELGEVPLQLENPEVKGACYDAGPGRFLLKVKGIARFLVKDGKEIVIHLFPDVSLDDMRVFLLDPVLGALLHQREMLPMQAAAVAVEDGCVLVCGPPASGKTTVVRALIKRGYPLIADGICVLRIDTGQNNGGQTSAVALAPGLSQQKIWRDSMKELGEDINSYSPVRSGLKKYSVPANECVVREDRPLPLKKIFVLTPYNHRHVRLTTLSGMERFEALNLNVYKASFVVDGKTRAVYFKTLGQTANTVPVIRAERPVKPFLLNELADALELESLSSTVRPGLETEINRDYLYELKLRRMRRLLLFRYHSDSPEPFPANYLPLVSTLAMQCFNNEYIFTVDSDEESLTAELEKTIEQAFEKTEKEKGSHPAECEVPLLLLSMYKPLYQTSLTSTLTDIPPESFSPPLRSCITRTLLEPLEELKLKETIPSFGTIADETSQAVRTQYEENPYPRWFTLPDKPPRPLSSKLSRFSSYRSGLSPFSPTFLPSSPPTFHLLIPGCGTGRHPLWLARGNPEAQITAIDLSKTSLAYGKRMASALNISNIQFRHGDLLELPETGERFHHIDCAGVLHHLENPESGWEALEKLTLPGGTLRIAVYSSVARLPVAFIRDEIGKLKLRPEPADMKAFRTRIMTDDKYRNLRDSLAASVDFHTTGSLRDLLFHTREHRYTLEQINEMIEKYNFTFLGFRLNHPAMKEKYREQFPDDPGLNRFDYWRQFEKAYTGTINMFDFWLQKPYNST